MTYIIELSGRTAEFRGDDLWLLDDKETVTMAEAIENRLEENRFKYNRKFYSSKYVIETNGEPAVYEYNGRYDGWIQLKKESRTDTAETKIKREGNRNANHDSGFFKERL